MSSKKKNAPQWREGDPVALHGKIGKIMGEDGQEKIAVELDGLWYRVTVSNDHVHPRD